MAFGFPAPHVGEWVFLGRPCRDLNTGKYIDSRTWLYITSVLHHTNGFVSIAGYRGNGEATFKTIRKALHQSDMTDECRLIRIPLSATLMGSSLAEYSKTIRE